MPLGEFLYRGTTKGWPGNRGPQELGITSTTTDPLVAALFALECSRHGAALIYVVPISLVADRIIPPNILAELECEVALRIAPIAFAEEFADSAVTLERACRALHAIGIETPATIANRRVLNRELKSAARLLEYQVAEFNQYVLG